ncbi:TetR/AcrR family transcriptional regulator [Agrobacterium sp. lyk4-40-TYG-31]|uniref:TetR/AcrR family transcriptional regulator n=1 Tax=Agrobacterium sp. lyk4-40-TYG-31 TaxID=3040276 RepID=UPI00254E183A|nr:TetR/AcrR family transcriptional regulator [Agrobacterium sp. lyk4-40-TYG-31]
MSLKPTVADAGAPASGVRRTPVQERGRRRVQQLLDAAADVIAEVGVDNATTNAIAARANTSVGVLYKFFPNKQALVEVMAEKYVTEIEGLIGQQENEGIADWPLRDAIEWIVRATVVFHKTNPAFHHVYRAVRGGSAGKSASLLDHTKAVISHLLTLRMPNTGTDRDLHATIVVEAAHALIVHACTLPAQDRARLTEETIVLLSRYLEPDYVAA